ncbi:MAG: DNA recombination/repair protein RecA, partial [Chloroflexota bacterium]
MALRFYASVRVDIRRIQAIKDSGDIIGNRTKITIKKNKVAPPFRTCEFDIMYNQGISKSGDILDIAVEEGIVEKRGAFFSYGEQRLAQGRENAKTFLEANPHLMTEIENKVREAKGLSPLNGTTPDQPRPEKKARAVPKNSIPKVSNGKPADLQPTLLDQEEFEPALELD